MSSDVSTAPPGDDDAPPTMRDLPAPDPDDTGDASTGEPEPLCEVPQQANADVSGMTSEGEGAFTAAVFAEAGGGKCPEGLRIVLGETPEHLASVIDGIERDGFAGALVIDLVIPEEGLVPGEWIGEMWTGAPHVFAPVVATVMVVPDFDSPAPLFELEVAAVDDPAWTMAGPVAAHYCGDVMGGACGA